MNRRRFLNTSTGGLAMFAAFPGGAIGQATQRARQSRGLSQTYGGLTLRRLRDQYLADLFTDFLPFMEKYVIDHEVGGFMCNTDHKGVRLNENKLSWFEGRGTWVYSFLYNNLAPEKKYLDVARRSIEFTLRSKPPPGELWPKELTREGKQITSADGEIYGDIFIAEGFAEFSKATGDRRYWDMAREILFKCLDIYDRPDYRSTIGQTYLGPNAKPFPGARIQGVWMVLIRLVTQMLEMRADAEIERVADRCVEAITKHHYNPEFNLINELLNHDLTRPADEYAQLVYTGHCIENLWMLLHEAARRRDKKLFETLSGWFKRHVEVAWDDVYGGVFRNLQNVERNVWLVDKVLWAQEEVLIGSMFIIEHLGVEWAKEMFDKTYTYVREKYPLKQHGSPLWMFASDRHASYEAFQKMPKRVENFHHPRHLMLNLLSIERMLKRSNRGV
jgi:mannose/cellobiose epimerase-like protein (N-acyl-D-glucosamine 2-epimerase family)